MSIARFQATHAVIANAPATVVTVSDDPVLSPRLFTGSGVPSSTTLKAGNGRYCAANAGWVLGATVAAAGTGYAVGNVLTVSGGTATTACQITVDAVTSTGAIMSFHVCTAGNYSAYPTNPASVTGGAGSGATFNLALQPPDQYFDTTGKNLYVCTTAGSNSTSVWAQIGGGGGGVNAQTGSYTAVAADNGKLITFASSTVPVLTLPTTPPSASWYCAVDCKSGGVAITTGASIDSQGGTVVISAIQGVMIYTDGTNYFTNRGVGAVQYYAITTLGNYDYMVCVPLFVSGSGSGLSVAFGSGTVNVAKHNRMRTSVGSELIDGVTITYSSYTSDNTRSAYDGTNTEYQVVFPRYVTAATLGYSTSTTLTGSAAYAFLDSLCVIKAAQISGGCGFADVYSNYIFLEELTPRVWARRYNQ